MLDRKELHLVQSARPAESKTARRIARRQLAGRSVLSRRAISPCRLFQWNRLSRRDPIYLVTLSGAPVIDAAGQLLVQVADGAGADPRPPECVGDVFHPPHRDARVVHLQQRLFHGALPPPVTLVDLGLEGQTPQFGYLQFYCASLRLQLALIMPCARVRTLRATLIPRRLAEPVRFRLQQAVQRLFHRLPHQLPELTLISVSLTAITGFDSVRFSATVFAMAVSPGFGCFA